jgi:hypothetical protein
MPSRQYAPKHLRTAAFGADGATRRLVSSLIVCNTSTTADASVTVWFGTSAPAGGFEGLRVTTPSHVSPTYLSHAEISGLTLAPGWGVWFRTNSNGPCQVESHYLEEFTGAPLNYDPRCAWVNASTAWTAGLPVVAKRRIVTSVNGCCIAGGDSSFRLYGGPAAPGNLYAAPRWAGLNPTYPTNFMSTLGVPMHLESGDALWVYGDTPNNYLQINYMEEQ